MFGNRSLFGYESDSPAARAAYDMMVLDQIEKDLKEEKLREMYGEEIPDEELEVMLND